jgi:hypothetical protein
MVGEEKGKALTQRARRKRTQDTEEETGEFKAEFAEHAEKNQDAG